MVTVLSLSTGIACTVKELVVFPTPKLYVVVFLLKLILAPANERLDKATSLSSSSSSSPLYSTFTLYSL